ncbi:hypothetical protein KJ603_02255 [Patescibacteria group bacterium]|nr:hypothetical protein [Patescibacteria group bacterium]
MELKKEVNYRINQTTLWLMASVTLCIDAIQFGIGTFSGLSTSAFTIPIIGIPIGMSIIALGFVASGFMSIFSYLTFWLWFKLKGIGLLDKGIGNLLAFIINLLVDVTIPFWPGLTITTLLIIRFSRVSDIADQKEILSRETQEKIGGKIINITDELKNAV